MNVLSSCGFLKNSRNPLYMNLYSFICLELNLFWTNYMKQPWVERITPARCFIKFVFRVSNLTGYFLCNRISVIAGECDFNKVSFVKRCNLSLKSYIELTSPTCSKKSLSYVKLFQTSIWNLSSQYSKRGSTTRFNLT